LKALVTAVMLLNASALMHAQSMPKSGLWVTQLHITKLSTPKVSALTKNVVVPADKTEYICMSADWWDWRKRSILVLQNLCQLGSKEESSAKLRVTNRCVQPDNTVIHEWTLLRKSDTEIQTVLMETFLFKQNEKMVTTATASSRYVSPDCKVPVGKK
jgi:hypothetical protein